MAYAFNALNNQINQPAQPKPFSQSQVFGAIKQNNQGDQKALEQQVSQPAQQQVQQQQTDFNKQVADYQVKSKANVAQYKPLDQDTLAKATAGDQTAMATVRQSLTAANPNAAKFDPATLATNATYEKLKAGDTAGVLKGQGASSSAANLDGMLFNSQPVVSGLTQQIDKLKGDQNTAATDLSAQSQAEQDAAVNARKLAATKGLYDIQSGIEQNAAAAGRTNELDARNKLNTAEISARGSVNKKLQDSQSAEEADVKRQFDESQQKVGDDNRATHPARVFNNVKLEGALRRIKDKYSQLNNQVFDKYDQTANTNADQITGAPQYTQEAFNQSGNIASLLGTTNNRQVMQGFNPNVNFNAEDLLARAKQRESVPFMTEKGSTVRRTF